MAWTNSSGNISLSAIPENGGIGFKAWNSLKSAAATSGYFLGDSRVNGIGQPDINSPVHNVSFALYGHTSTFAEAWRSLADPLGDIQDEFFVKFCLNYRSPGYKGVDVRDSSNNILFAFQAVEGTPFDKYEYYNANTSTYINLNPAGQGGTSNWDYASDGIYTLSARRVNSTQTTFLVFRRLQSNPNDYRFAENTVTGTVSAVRFFNGNQQNSDLERNLYFNTLSSYNPYR